MTNHHLERSRRHALRLAAALTSALAVVLAACGGAADDAAPTSRTPAADAARVSAKSVGAGGGSVSTTAADGTAYTLQIPAGALATPVEIRLTPITDMGSAPLAANVRGAVLMEPSGLRFRIPATLRITGAAAVPAGKKLIGFSTANDGSRFRLNLARQEGAAALVHVTHFSTGGTAAAAPAELPPLVPLAPRLADADDAVARLAELAARDAGLVQIVDVFRQWFVEIVRPALTQADGSTDPAFQLDAMLAYKEWISAMDFVADRASLELALADELRQAAPAATRVFRAAIAGNLADCASSALTTTARLASVSLASTMQGVAQSVGLAGLGTGLDRVAFLAQVNGCVRVVIDPITLPVPLSIGSGRSLDARAQIVFANEPSPLGGPFGFTVSATGATVANPSGLSDAAGRFTTVFVPSATAVSLVVQACLVLDTAAAVAGDICASQTVRGGSAQTYSGVVSFQQLASGTTFSGFLRVSLGASGAVNSIRIVEASGAFQRTDGTGFNCGPPPQQTVRLQFSQSTPLPMTARFVVNGSTGQFEFDGRLRTIATDFVNASQSCATTTRTDDDPTLRTLAAFPFITVETVAGIVQAIVLDQILTFSDGSSNVYTGRLQPDR